MDLSRIVWTFVVAVIAGLFCLPLFLWMRTGKAKWLAISALEATFLSAAAALGFVWLIGRSPTPQVKSVEQLIVEQPDWWGEQWVTVRGKLRCETQQEVRGDDQSGFVVPLTGEHETATAIFARFQTEAECHERLGEPLTGLVTNLPFEQYRDLQPLMNQLKLRSRREGALLKVGAAPSDSLRLGVAAVVFSCVFLLSWWVIRRHPDSFSWQPGEG